MAAKPRFNEEYVRLNQLCAKGKSSLRQKDIENDGPYTVYGASGVVGSMATFQNDSQYVAVVKDGAGVGRATLCPENTSVLGTMQALIPKENVLPEYLLHLVRSMRLGEGFSGSTIPHIYFKDYGQRMVKLISVNEQEHIVETLESIERQIDSVREQSNKLDALVKSRFTEMFGDPNLGRQCREWPSLGNLTTIATGATPKTKVPNYWDGTLPWITPAEISERAGVVVNTRKKITAAAVEATSVTLLPVNSVLLSTRAPIGKTAIVGAEMYCNQGFKAFLPCDKFNSIYLYTLLSLNVDYLNSMGTGATFKELSKKFILEMKVPCPPIDEQEKLAAFVAEVDKSRFIAQQQIEKLQMLYDSLAQEYFS